MTRLSYRQCSQALVVAVVAAILWDRWVLAPVLDVVTIRQWWLVADGVALLVGVASGFWTRSVFFSVAALISGILAGGIWSEWSPDRYFVPNLVRSIRDSLDLAWPRATWVVASASLDFHGAGIG
ncbi:MAG TPA: hypothetical protein VGK32_04160 [Vicinamibacterales bacterium]|jgi:hypothetical protein